MTFGAIETFSRVFDITSIERFHLIDINLNKIQKSEVSKR